MNNLQLTLLIICSYICGALLLSFIFDLVKKCYCANKVKFDTMNFIYNLGFVNCFCGQQGAGKSTMASGVANMLTEKLLNDSQQRIMEIQVEYPKVNFEVIDNYIRSCFELGILNTDYIIFALFNIDSYVLDTFQSGYKDDTINYVANLENFRDYIDAFVALLKMNYVYFLNKQFYCRVTKKYAMPLDYNSIAIKDRYINKDYNISRYSILFQDEILLSGGSNSFWQSEVSEDPGISDYFRLIRHIGKKTMYYISTAQDFNRIIKSRRELFNNIFEIFGHQQIITNKLHLFFIDILENVVTYIYKFICDGLSRENLMMFQGRHDKAFRILLNKFQIKRKKLESSHFIKYQGNIYTDPDDYLKTLDKTTHPSGKFISYFPITYVYGCLNTYEYSSVHDVLSLVSKDSKLNYQFDDKPTLSSRDEFAKGILAKRKSKKVSNSETVDDGSNGDNFTYIPS